MSVIVPKDYISKLDIIETENAIKLVKDTFEIKLAQELSLTRVSAPLFVTYQSGLNDHLSGVEKPVSFQSKALDDKIEIVQSLAKWKRMALGKYNFKPEMGLYTDMNAIRKDEDLDNIHSIYVDQWDWEKVIIDENRCINYLKMIVKRIVKAISLTKDIVNKEYQALKMKIADDVYFITSEELLLRYPNYSAKERENAICREHKTVFLIGIGDTLSNGQVHDTRAPDYDDWSLNGDILIWYEPLNQAIELSSMGIRVDKQSLMKQLEKANKLERLKYTFHQNIINDLLPLSIGGGIGQSRLCLIMLEKIHIGEVQVSLWSDEDLKVLNNNKVLIL